MIQLQNIQSNSVLSNAPNNLTSPASASVVNSVSQATTSSGLQINRSDDAALKTEQNRITSESSKPAKTIEPTTRAVDSAELDSLTMSLNTQFEKLQNYVKFERDESSQNMVVFVKNSETNEVIRQIPTQEFLAISKNINEYIEMRQQLSEKISPPVGLFTNETA